MMDKEQKRIAKAMLKEGSHTFGKIYQAVYGTDPLKDCTCSNPKENGCTCEVSNRMTELVMLQYEVGEEE